MLEKRSIRSLYPLALAEGEGVGTAYEYAAKRQVLRHWLKQSGISEPPGGTLLISGLPEIYGSSLDYFLLAHECNRPVLVVDEDVALLQKAEKAVQSAQTTGMLTGLQPRFLSVSQLTQMGEVSEPIGWAICNEVLQRFSASGRYDYTNRLASLAKIITLFAPNGDNQDHATRSGLAALPPAEMQQLVESIPKSHRPVSGFCDMPPFPPGITRSAEQRAHAETGYKEAIAMWGLDWFVRLEGILPAGWQQRQAHIVYGFFLTSEGRPWTGDG